MWLQSSKQTASKAICAMHIKCNNKNKQNATLSRGTANAHGHTEKKMSRKFNFLDICRKMFQNVLELIGKIIVAWMCEHETIPAQAFGGAFYLVQCAANHLFLCMKRFAYI